MGVAMGAAESTRAVTVMLAVPCPTVMLEGHDALVPAQTACTASAWQS
jgi:hypothetical protein